jgi:Kae1-associated kinase Bud32
MTIIAQGAEAVLEKHDGKLIKNRIKKSYRAPEIDIRLRKQRTKLEAKLLGKAQRLGVSAPHVFEQDDFSITMEFIPGEKVKNILSKKNEKEICKKIGLSVSLLHNAGIIHGDLTTSNMILKQNKLYLIDFGLGFHSSRLEDKATDLHLLQEALESTHFSIVESAWKIILNTYKKNAVDSEQVIKTLNKIQKRGRYKKRD